MSIRIPLAQIKRRLGNGKLWTRGWGDYDSPDTPTCLHGAIRHCMPQLGDAYIIEQVGKKYGWGTGDNDNDDTTYSDLINRVPREVTDEMLESTFGPQWREIVALVRRSATLTDKEVESLDAAGNAAWNAAGNAARYAAGNAAWNAAWYAARYAARYAAWDAAWDAAGDAAWYAARYAAWDAAGDAAGALCVRDLIGKHGFTQEHYDTLTMPWRKVIGRIHPDDAEVTK